jgi:hypothetical protein
MSQAFERFTAYLKISVQLIDEASNEDIAVTRPIQHEVWDTLGTLAPNTPQLSPTQGNRYNQSSSLIP